MNYSCKTLIGIKVAHNMNRTFNDAALF